MAQSRAETIYHSESEKPKNAARDARLTPNAAMMFYGLMD
jgi:hypothetical protein